MWGCRSVVAQVVAVIHSEACMEYEPRHAWNVMFEIPQVVLIGSHYSHSLLCPGCSLFVQVPISISCTHTHKHAHTCTYACAHSFERTSSMGGSTLLFLSTLRCGWEPLT